ncbi:MAG TPA: zinc-dependent alcohol dehydrogenase family protein [Syntrophorhabdaceae bacterium]|nr:zinc-dependent alcohol dehydrogenase family protein [Syntrophorhabdaceae bacterium]HQM82539.1 zinc-dependent alcohol dehydrogenase family protein [Syntrophorhabdaceae bacterium]
MKAMVINRICRLDVDKKPLESVDMPVPVPAEKELLIKVSVCGVCHTELDEIEGRTPPPVFPMIPGHQVIGKVAETGSKVTKFRKGERVGIAWIHSACGACKFCIEGNENLCADFEATGRDVHGGYAEFTTVGEDFAYRVPEEFTDFEAAPLLCAGTIGYRSLRLTDMKDGETLALIGFGASAHLVIQMAQYRYPNSKIFVFARSAGERQFAKELGASWTGNTSEEPPEKFHRAIDTTPVWGTIVDGLKNMERGGRLVINAIRKEDQDKKALLRIDYPEHLWLEKEIKSVANVAGQDVQEFLELAAKIPIKPEVQVYRLEEANQALVDLKERRIRGAKVLKIS